MFSGDLNMGVFVSVGILWRRCVMAVVKEGGGWYTWEVDGGFVWLGCTDC